MLMYKYNKCNILAKWLSSFRSCWLQHNVESVYRPLPFADKSGKLFWKIQEN